jgi:hypothetical protein
MGLFKDMKKLNQEAKKHPRPKMNHTLSQSVEALETYNTQQAQATDLMTSGMDGQASIKMLQATGKMVNHFPEVSFQMEVSVGGGSPYAVNHAQVVSPVSLPALQPGMTVPIKVSQEDPQTVWLMVG